VELRELAGHYLGLIYNYDKQEMHPAQKFKLQHPEEKLAV